MCTQPTVYTKAKRRHQHAYKWSGRQKQVCICRAYVETDNSEYQVAHQHKYGVTPDLPARCVGKRSQQKRRSVTSDAFYEDDSGVDSTLRRTYGHTSYVEQAVTLLVILINKNSM